MFFNENCLTLTGFHFLCSIERCILVCVKYVDLSQELVFVKNMFTLKKAKPGFHAILFTHFMDQNTPKWQK